MTGHRHTAFAPPGHSHSHSPAAAPLSRRARLVLAGLVAAIVIPTVAGLVVLWPKADERPAQSPYWYSGTTLVTGQVTGSVPGRTAGELTVRLEDGEEVYAQRNPDIPLTEFPAGVTVTLAHTDAGGGTVQYIFADFPRGKPLALLVGLFALAVVAVARLKGLAALAGLAGALAVVWFFLIPALLAGRDPLAVALVTSSAVMVLVLYLAHGVSAKTTTALLGTLGGVAAVAALAAWAIPATFLTPSAHEGAYLLTQSAPGLDLRGLLLCGMVLAGVGVLNDVTITQASAVWELRAAGQTNRRALFGQAMRIGRDHIASTVYTIAFAYVGGALSVLMLASLYDHSLTELFTFEDIASEIVPILVASIGLVLAIPLTTAIAAILGAPRDVLTAPPSTTAASKELP